MILLPGSNRQDNTLQNPEAPDHSHMTRSTQEVGHGPGLPDDHASLYVDSVGSYMSVSECVSERSTKVCGSSASGRPRSLTGVTRCVAMETIPRLEAETRPSPQQVMH